MIEGNIKELIEYLKGQESLLKRQNKTFELYSIKIKEIEDIINSLDITSNDSFTDEQINILKDKITEVLDQDSDLNQMIKDFDKYIVIYPYTKDEDLKQNSLLEMTTSYFSNLIKKLYNVKINLTIKEAKEKYHYNDNQKQLLIITKYLEYLTSDYGSTFLSEEELNTFLDLINNSTLNEETRMNLILEFSKGHINYYTKERLFRTKIEAKSIEHKIESTGKVISEQGIIKEAKVSPKKKGVNLAVLSTEERQIVEEVKKLKERFNITSSINVKDLLKGKRFSFDERNKVYSAYNGLNYWVAVTSDIDEFMLPTLYANNSNTDNILNIFRLLLAKADVYEVNLQNPNLELIEEIAEKFETLTDKINNYKASIKELINECHMLSAADNNTIDSMMKYLNNNDEGNALKVTSKYSINFAKLVGKVKELEDLSNLVIKDYKSIDAVKDEKELLEFLKETCILHEQKLKQLFSQIDDLKDTATKEELEPDSNTQIFIYLTNHETGDYFINEDIETIKNGKTGKENIYLSNLKTGLDKMSQISMSDMNNTSAGTCKKIKNSIDTSKDHVLDKDFDPHRYRSNYIRIAYNALPISSYNRKLLAEVLDLNPKADYCLIIGAGVKNTDHDDVYSKFITDLNAELTNITKLFSIFKEDAKNDATKYELIKIVGDSVSLYKRIVKDEKKIGGSYYE